MLPRALPAAAPLEARPPKNFDGGTGSEETSGGRFAIPKRCRRAASRSLRRVPGSSLFSAVFAAFTWCVPWEVWFKRVCVCGWCTPTVWRQLELFLCGTLILSVWTRSPPTSAHQPSAPPVRPSKARSQSTGHGPHNGVDDVSTRHAGTTASGGAVVADRHALLTACGRSKSARRQWRRSADDIGDHRRH